jgi:hypothetical protein
MTEKVYLIYIIYLFLWICLLAYDVERLRSPGLPKLEKTVHDVRVISEDEAKLVLFNGQEMHLGVGDRTKFSQNSRYKKKNFSHIYSNFFVYLAILG